MRVSFRCLAAVICGLSLICLTGCPPTPPPPPDGPFSEMIIFGDSLSDIGNDFRETIGLVPHAPYSEGRFSNGTVWSQLVAEHFGLPLKAFLDGGTNYAYGGAETGLGHASFNGIPLIPNMREQLKFYTATPKGTELFVVWGGANDLFADLDSGGAIEPELMATNIAIIVIELYARGALSFVVPNLPEFGDLPRYVNTSREAEATAASNRFNAALAEWLDRIDDLPGITIYRPDTAEFFNEKIANPPPPLTNTTQPAWTGNFFGTDGTVVPDPDTHVFWDEVHPTRISHGLLGQYMIDQIEANLVIQPAPLASACEPPEDGATLIRWIEYIECRTRN